MNVLEWEYVSTDGGPLQRSKTPTGWLVREVSDVIVDDPNRGMQSGWSWTTALTFVPDPEHVWLKPTNDNTGAAV